MSIRGRTAFSPATARKHYLAAILAAPEWSPRLEDEFRGEVPVDLLAVAKRMESKALRLRKIRLIEPRPYQYAIAETLADNAMRLRRYAVRAGLTRTR